MSPPDGVLAARLRRIYRALACGACTLVAGTTTALGALALAGSPRASGRFRDRMTALWSRGLTRILGLRIAVEGSPPPRGALLVANHVSYVDILLIAARLPCAFVARADVEGWPVIGLLCKAAGVIFVDRSRRTDAKRAGDALLAALERGRTVVLFPEGTSSDGTAVLPFRSSLLDGAARTGRPVFAAAVGYRTIGDSPPAETAIAWWGDDEFLPHLATLLTVPRTEARIRFASEPVVASDRKQLAVALQRTVASEHALLRAHLESL
jgi:1-acyl-sn-glycerol-3-phosphate acyltransferase